MFFHAYMYGPLQGKLRIYGARMVSADPVAMPNDWVVFASMLVDDLGRKLGSGVDLRKHEVKSAKRGGGYEYQYHKDHGREKLLNDATVGHLFFDYTEGLKEIDLRYLHASQMAIFFDDWLKEFPTKPEDYKGQRFRKRIPYGFVKKNGKLLMTLANGEVVFPQIVREAKPTTENSEKSEGASAEE